MSASHSGSSAGAIVVGDAARQVLVEQERPQPRVRGRRGRDDLAHDDLARRARVRLLVGAHRVERVAVLDDRGLQRLRAAALALRVVEPVVPPRAAAVEHAGPLRPHVLVDRAHRFDVVARRAGAQRRAGLRSGSDPRLGTARDQRRRAGGDPVAEAPVDPALRRPQGRDRVAALAQVVELAPHHRGEQAAPPVRRHDRDRGDRGTRQGAAGHGQLARERAGRRDDLPVVEPGERALGLEDTRVARAVVVAELAMERPQHRAAVLLELRAGRGTQLHPACLAARR